MTMVPRTGPLSASSALATTSWYHRGKSVPWGVRMGAFAMTADAMPSKVGGGPGLALRGEHGIGPPDSTGREFGDTACPRQQGEGPPAEVRSTEVAGRHRHVRIPLRRRRAGPTGQQPRARVPRAELVGE